MHRPGPCRRHGATHNLQAPAAYGYSFDIRCYVTGFDTIAYFTKETEIALSTFPDLFYIVLGVRFGFVNFNEFLAIQAITMG